MLASLKPTAATIVRVTALDHSVRDRAEFCMDGARPSLMAQSSL